MEEGVRRSRKTPQEASKGAQKGPQSSQNETQKSPKLGPKSVENNVGKKHTKNLKIDDPLE